MFAKKSLQIDRSLLNKRDNAVLDEKLERLLMLLSGYLLERRAQKVVEFLLRQYAVHRLNVDALMRCALPYHDSPIFARVVAVARTKKTLWAFASALVGSPSSSSTAAAAAPSTMTSAVSRLALAKRCMIDSQLLLFVCEAAARDDAPRLWIAFYALLVVDVLGECATSGSVAVQQQLTHIVLPFALQSARAVAASAADVAVGERRHAGCLVLAQLALRMRIVSETALQQLVDALVNAAAHADTTRVALLALAHAARAQLVRHIAPSTAARLLRDVPRLGATLVALYAERCDVAPLASLIVCALTTSCVAGASDALACVATMLAGARQLVDAQAVAALAVALVRALASLRSSSSSNDAAGDARWSHVCALVRALDSHHADLLDASLSSALRDAAGHEADQLLDALGAALPAVARHAAMSAHRTTLGAALAHPNAALRKRAVRRLDLLLRAQHDDTTNNNKNNNNNNNNNKVHRMDEDGRDGNSNNNANDDKNKVVVASDTQQFARRALLDALRDDDYRVARRALEAVAAHGALLAGDATLLHALRRALAQPKLAAAALSALAAATAPLATAPTSDIDVVAWRRDVAPLIVSRLLAQPQRKLRSVARAARRVCGDVALLNALGVAALLRGVDAVGTRAGYTRKAKRRSSTGVAVVARAQASEDDDDGGENDAADDDGDDDGDDDDEKYANEGSVSDVNEAIIAQLAANIALDVDATLPLCTALLDAADAVDCQPATAPGIVVVDERALRLLVLLSLTRALDDERVSQKSACVTLLSRAASAALRTLWAASPPADRATAASTHATQLDAIDSAAKFDVVPCCCSS